MVECGSGASFLLEALETLRISRNSRGEHFDRHVAGKASVSCAIDLAHPARPNEGDDFISAKTNAGREGHGLSKVGL